MSVVRIVKDKNFITMGKYHLKEKEMSLKAKGLLSQMLSLPDEWDYSIKGLVKINKESYDSIRSALKELEQFGYLKRTQIQDKGKFVDVEYTIYEKPITGNPITEKPITGNQTQLNNKELNNNLIEEINNKENIKRKNDIEDIINYLNELCGTNYRTTTQSTLRHINARFNEGFTYKDFINVIINKTDEWLGTDMEKYLTPDTLFGTKFEKYLNQGGHNVKK